MISTTPASQAVPMVGMSELSAALDEIYELRRLLAYAAAVTETHLQFRAFPKRCRPIAERQVDQMRQAAAGDYPAAVAAIGHRSLRTALVVGGIEETMTRSRWQQQRGKTTPDPPI